MGAVFALAAYGLALVWGVTSVKNLAQGDFVMLGGYLGYELSRHGVHPIVAIVPVAAPVTRGAPGPPTPDGASLVL